MQMADQASSNPELQLRLIKVINKRYINSLSKNMTSRIEFFSTQQRKGLEEKLSEKTGLDINIFDGLNQTVLEHLESKCYPNFLTSEVYIEHVQSYQNQDDCILTGGQTRLETAIALDKFNGSYINNVNAPARPHPLCICTYLLT